MKIARSFHTATLLPNGKVLVAGGAQSQSASSAELYDPASDTWTVTGTLRVGRSFHTATLLRNGKVLVVGGGPDGGTELFDPTTGSWTLTGSMRARRVIHATTLLPNGKVLVVGGAPGAELYDPASGTWSVTGSPSNAVRTATLLPNKKVLAESELYDPGTGAWTSTGAPSVYYYTATLLLNGKVLAAGGTRTFTAELYDPDSGTWSPTGSLTWDRDYCTATLLPGGQVLIAGGVKQGPDIAIPSAELFDPSTGTWTETPMRVARFSHAAALLPNGNVLVCGGLLDSSLNLTGSAEIYQSDSDGARAFILLQPTDVMVKIPPDPQAASSTNATFSIVAFGASAIAYQWRFNGTPIPNATSSFLTVTNVQLADEGVYTVEVTDATSTTVSTQAKLLPLISPTIVQPPLGQTVAVGGAVTLGVMASGHPLPFSFEWRRGSTTVASNLVNSYANFYSYTAPNIPTQQIYRVIVRNLANQAVTANGSVTNYTVADSDGDGIPDGYEAA